MAAYTLRQLEYFLAIAEAKSISAAAQTLHVTPTAVASALNELERVLRTQLVVRRKAHGITLTPTGSYLFQRVTPLLREADEVELAIASKGTELVGPLSVGCYSTIAPTVAPLLMEWVRRHHPRVELTVLTGSQAELPQQLLAGVLDLAIGYDIGLPDGLESVPLYQAPPYVLLPTDHRLTDRGELSITDLVDEPMILLDLPPAAQHTLKLFSDVGEVPAIAQRVSDFELVRALVARGFGYSILIQRPAVNRSYEGLPLSVREITSPSQSGSVLMMWSPQVRLTDRARALVDFASAHANRLDPRNRG